MVAPSKAEVVRFAGGWLFDRAAAGWDVTVLTSDPRDCRPLRILGARTTDLESVLASPVRGPRPRAIALGADACDCDSRVRRLVLEALSDGVAEVRCWGDRWPADLDGEATPVRHRLSVAAQAFKAQALAAVAVRADPGEVTETFRTGAPHRSPA